jgi:hypothetical protein
MRVTSLFETKEKKMVITVNTKEIEKIYHKYPELVHGAAFAIGAIAAWKLAEKLFEPKRVTLEATVKQLNLMNEMGGRIHYYTDHGEFLLIPWEGI